jgi:hypothetical protein
MTAGLRARPAHVTRYSTSLAGVLYVNDSSVALHVREERRQLLDACRRRAPALLREDHARGQALQPRDAGAHSRSTCSSSWTPLRDSAWLARPRSV